MRILFITSTRLGDAILSTGLLHHLLVKQKNCSVTIACGSVAAELFEKVPGLERIIILDKMLFSFHWLYLWANCVGNKWDVIVDLRNAPITYLIPTKKAYRLVKSRMPGHRVETLADVMDLKKDIPAPYIWLSDQHRAAAAHCIPSGSPVLSVGPTANWRGKEWNAENFIGLIRRLTAPDGILPHARVAIFGRDDERPKALQVVESVPDARRIDLVGRVNLPTAFACLQRSNFYFGNDSGLMHLAAASGIPTLGLFGPSPEERYAPWGPMCAVVRGELGYDKIFPPNFDHRSTDTLMDGLSIDAAEKKAIELWGRVGEQIE